MTGRKQERSRAVWKNLPCTKGDDMTKGGIPELLNFKQKGKDMNEFIKVPVSEKLAYCFGDPALTLMYTMTTTLLIYFYTNVVGISAGAVGMIMLLSRVFDGFSDVLMGTIIDRTHSKYGKARIWILRLAIPYALAAVLLFTMPPMGNTGKVIYAFVTYNIMNTVVYTAISQPFHALGSLMSRDRRERDIICNIRMVLSITASMVITAFTLPLINQVAKLIDNQQAAWIIVTAAYALVSVFVLLNTYCTCTERVSAVKQTKEEKSDVPFLKAFKVTVTNRYFLIALGLMIFYTAYQIIIGTDLTYYCQYVLNDVDLVMPLSAAEKIATIIGIAMLPRILPKYGKRRLICAGCILGIAGQLLFLLNITSVPLGVVTCIMRGIGIAPFYGVQYSLPSDAIEYGHWKNGVRVEGLMFSSMSMGQKAGSGFTSAIMGAILSMAAFDGLKATAAEQTASAIAAIKNFYLYVPIALWAVMFIIAACYKLDKMYDSMMRELISREGKEHPEEIPVQPYSGNRINIAVGRVYGSSGRIIAERLAEKLDCRVYDRQIICLLAEKLGMENADLEEVQKYLDNYNYGGPEPAFSPYAYPKAGVAGDLSPIQTFETQCRIILGLAQNAPGVFLGRCANFVLNEQKHTYSFFLYADDAYREKEGKEYYGQTLSQLNQKDALRNEYYQRFTGMRRDDPANYDMVVNVSKTGVDGAVSMILDYVYKKEEEQHAE
ncbi:MAG: glycoside-pentoside-hexuronide (GPH):cation symporter [Eubacteriales bacterium]|nr:glycoside-pentoside-hexuronide (GPH):cation symporter [Eubacteriales bacterium]